MIPIRTLTAAQSAVLSGTIKKHAINVYILDATSTWMNLSNLDGFDFVQNVNINSNIDDPVMTANITLISKMFHYNLCPEVSNKFNNTDALLRLNAQIRITTATIPEGKSAEDEDWQNVFEGYITKISVNDNGRTIQLFCRDLGAKIQDVFIKTELSYGADDGSITCEAAIQDILDDNGLDEIILYTPTSPNFAIKFYTQQRQSVMQAIQEIALQPGFNLRYRWDTGTEAWRLTLYEPDRDKTTVDFTFADSLYCMIPNYEYDISSIRNLIKIVFTSLGSSGICTQTIGDNYFSDNTKSWVINEYLYDSVVITGGTGAGQEKQIIYNSSSTVTIGSTWAPTTPNTCSTYKIISRRKEIDYPENGIATSATTAQIVDTTKAWTNDFWIGYDLYIYDGTGSGNQYSIVDSSYTKLLPSTTWIVQPDATSRYAIVNSADTGDGIYNYGGRYMEITEAASSQIDTKTEARAMARAIYNDLSRFNIVIQIEVDYFYPVELGDLYTFGANNIIFDNDITLAVVGFTHSLGADESGNQRNSTVLELRGQPSGGYNIWFEREGTPGTAPINRFPATVTGLALSTAAEISGTTSYVNASWTFNSEIDLTEYQIRYQRGGVDWTYLVVPAIYNSVKIPMLKVSTLYTFQIRAINKTGKASDWSSSVTVTTSA